MASPSTTRRSRGKRGKRKSQPDISPAPPTSTIRPTDPPIHSPNPAPRRHPRRRRRNVPLQQTTTTVSSIPAHRRRRVWLPVDIPRERAPASGDEEDEPEPSESEPSVSEPRTYSPSTKGEDQPDAYVVPEGGETSHRWMGPRGYVSPANVSEGKGKERRKGAEEDIVAAVDDREPVTRTMTSEEHPPEVRSNIPRPSRRSIHLARNPDREDDGGQAGSGETKPASEALPNTARHDTNLAPYIQRFGSSAPPHQTAPTGRRGRRAIPPGRPTAWPTRPLETSTSHATASGVARREGEDLLSFGEDPHGRSQEDSSEEEEEEEDLISFD
ncbi:MAG: hypothetical protein LQ344_006767 [Seirophora lacunosa]|nr:MAG: hypothetical protein LQ344_006767 [Seirophora lacunosa]